MKGYRTIEQINNLIDRLVERGAVVYELIPGTLGFGLTVVTGAQNTKTAVITEVYLNEWSSANTVRLYNRLPKKYAVMIGKYLTAV